MADDIPTIDQTGNDSSNSDETGRLYKAESDLLEEEAKSLRLSNSEGNQRYWLRWLVVILGLIVITGMAFLLYHATHKIFWGPFVMVPNSLSIALLLAPIVSITTITVVFFVAAFRKFNDRDIDAVDPVAMARAAAQTVNGNI